MTPSGEFGTLNEVGRATADIDAAAHVLRRTTFGPYPGAIAAALDAHGTAAAVIEAQLAAAPVPFSAPMDLDAPTDPAASTGTTDTLVRGWIARMLDPAAGLHEKMMWFWHTVFTSSTSKADGPNCWRQLRLLHRHALGNFGDLARSMNTDGAMLQWLDGGLSTPGHPNENYGRELLELFTLGRGHYTEQDIRTAARFLAGWTPDRGAPRPSFSDAPELHEPGEFLGATAVFTPDTLIDRILEQEATAPFIVAKLAAYLVGGDVPAATIDAWASTFRSSGYEIQPVVATMLRSPEFTAARWSRARNGIEWLCASVAAMRSEVPSSWVVQDFAQVPFWPLNVAGWPNRWLTASSLFARAGFLVAQPVTWVPASDADPVDAAIDQCSLVEVSPSTRTALANVVATQPDDPPAVLRAALMSPEFAVA